MSKRKLAVAMAGAMVATAVVPAFAAESFTVSKGSQEAEKLVNDLRALINDENKKFQVDGNLNDVAVGARESIYGIVATKKAMTSAEVASLYTQGADGNHTFTATQVTVDGSLVNEQKEITNLVDLSVMIDLLEKDEELYVYVVDKGHETVDGKLSPVLADKTTKIDEEVVGKVTVNTAVSGEQKFDISEFYDGSILTSKGLDLLEVLNDTRATNGKYYTDDYIVTEASAPAIAADNKTISMIFDIDYKNVDKLDEKVKVTINSKDAGYSARLLGYLTNPSSYTKTAKLAGEDRYSTAAAIAEKSGLSKDNGTVVIVNSTSMIDGLTAAPYAAALNADVLLTSKDSVPAATMNFIAGNGIKNVVIIGGKSVVSDEVVNQLSKTAKVQVSRVGGADRQETSVLVANKIKDTLAKENKTVQNAFVVGSTGEADAMSIAPIAVEKDAPIIVEGFDGLSSYAKEFLRGKEIDAIGGKVSAETINTLKVLDNDDIVPFVSGSDRFSTNAKIIKKYYTTGTVNNVYVAKDGYTEANNEALVDALAVGTLAGATATRGPVVLASSELTVEQKEAIKLVDGAKGQGTNQINKLTQIGGGIKHAVMSTIDKLVNLI